MNQTVINAIYVNQEYIEENMKKVADLKRQIKAIEEHNRELGAQITEYQAVLMGQR